MVKAGYSKNTAKAPTKMTNTEGWQKLMDENLPDKDLAKVHKEGLKAFKKEHKIVDRDEDGKPIYDFVNVDDFATRHKYLETGYKLKGYYKEEKQNDKPETIKITQNILNVIVKAEDDVFKELKKGNLNEEKR